MRRQLRKRIGWHRRQAGGSLVELLVVIVVFLVGILAVAQIFPTGLNVLRVTRNNTIAANLARAEMQRLNGITEQLPEAILFVDYLWNGNGFTIVADPDRRPEDLSPRANRLTQQGDFVDPNGRTLGEWPYFAGANVARRIVGEGRTLPAPRFVQGASGLYGSLLTLRFAPVLSDPRFDTLFQVYGNDFQIRVLEDLPLFFPLRRNSDYIAYIDEEGTGIALPQGVNSIFPNRPTERRYRISGTVWLNGPNGVFSKDIVGEIIRVPNAPAGQQRFVLAVDFNAPDYGLGVPGQVNGIVGPGETFLRMEIDTLRVARLYDEVSQFGFTPQSEIDAQPDRLPEAVYEYITLSPALGQLLFNPLGFEFRENRRGRGFVPLSARADYTVLDWRVIRDDLRIPLQRPYTIKLSVPSIRPLDQFGPDSRPNRGIGVLVPDAQGNPRNTDFALLDMETGGVVLPTSYELDYVRGVLSFRDVDNDPSNGLTIEVMFSRATQPARLNRVEGRSLRALYQGRADWAVQALKPSQSYSVAGNVPLRVSQVYVGGSNPNITGDEPTRIYFPTCDIGSKVVVGEIWYVRGNELRLLQDQEFLVRAPRGGTPPFNRYGYIDIRDKDGGADAFDFSRGYAVRRVRGASMTVRVLWNPNQFRLSNDPIENFSRYQRWAEGWRVVSTQNFLMVGQD